MYIKVRRGTEHSFCTSLHVQNTRTQVYEDRLFKPNANECIIVRRMFILFHNNVFIIGGFNGASSSSH